ncbi:hypothetical protein C5167_032996 [Papaver somniferum]|uniref:Uncharacterized protein n=1 Tax=Papaver somniferum TaxID=3469 RepID=A0A4Y7K927_PAPSO|nr:hypothetical protein C5167_032996 [Papaver somniferum]
MMKVRVKKKAPILGCKMGGGPLLFRFHLPSFIFADLVNFDGLERHKKNTGVSREAKIDSMLWISECLQANLFTVDV